jgi:hypothetical protein
MLSRSLRILVVPSEVRWTLTGPMTLGGLAVLACAFTRLSGLDHAGVSFCYFKALTGRACLTCGTTRALGHLARWDPPSAYAIQPLVTVGALGLMAWGALDAVLLLAGRRTVVRTGGRAPRLLLAVAIALAALNWTYLLATGV